MTQATCPPVPLPGPPFCQPSWSPMPTHPEDWWSHERVHGKTPWRLFFSSVEENERTTTRTRQFLSTSPRGHFESLGRKPMGDFFSQETWKEETFDCPQTTRGIINHTTGIFPPLRAARVSRNRVSWSLKSNVFQCLTISDVSGQNPFSVKLRKKRETRFRITCSVFVRSSDRELRRRGRSKAVEVPNPS